MKRKVEMNSPDPWANTVRTDDVRVDHVRGMGLSAGGCDAMWCTVSRRVRQACNPKEGNAQRNKLAV